MAILQFLGKRVTKQCRAILESRWQHGPAELYFPPCGGTLPHKGEYLLAFFFQEASFGSSTVKRTLSSGIADNKV